MRTLLHVHDWSPLGNLYVFPFIIFFLPRLHFHFHKFYLNYLRHGGIVLIIITLHVHTFRTRNATMFSGISAREKASLKMYMFECFTLYTYYIAVGYVPYPRVCTSYGRIHTSDFIIYKKLMRARVRVVPILYKCLLQCIGQICNTSGAAGVKCVYYVCRTHTHTQTHSLLNS